MAHYPPERKIDGALKQCFQLTLGAICALGLTYVLATSGAWEAACLSAIVTAVMAHIARTMPLKETLVGSGAIYKRARRSW